MVTCLILFALVVLGVMNGLSSDTIFYVGFGLFAIYYGVRVGISHLALMEYNKGNYTKAISICEAQAKLFSSDPYPHTLAACAHTQLKQHEKTIESATQGIARCGDFKLLLHLRGDAYLHLWNAEKALDDAATAIRQGQSNNGIYMLKALALAHLNRHREAMEVLENVEIQKEQLIISTLLRARILDNMNQHEEALRECSKVFEQVEPYNMDYALTIRCFIHANLEHWDQAVADINAAVELAANSKLAFTNRAYLFGRLKRLEDAHADLDQALTIQTIQGTGYIESNRARLLIMEGKVEEALKFSTQAADEAPNMANILATHGLVLLRNGKTEEAKVLLDRAIQLDPYEKEAFWFRSEYYEKVGDARNTQRDKSIARGFKYIPYL